ncbi:MAG: hypothetical protein E6Q97_02405 [Desulfurellales bacterium]|nr:MAG: hypothetical protein E6Q97_02405 [Desulfurellales bacterium]
MAWAPIDQRDRDGLEMIKLRRLTGLPVATLLGHVTLLWLWALDNAPDGVLPSDHAIIASAAQWEGDAERWSTALITSGYIHETAEGLTLTMLPARLRKCRPWHRGADNQKGRRTPEYRQWRAAVLARDNWRCTECGSTKHLEAHHIKEYALYPALRLDPTNGITLCDPCHEEEHRRRRDGR